MHSKVVSTIFTPSVAVVLLVGCAVILAFFAVRRRVRQYLLRAIRCPLRASFLGGNFGQILHTRVKAFHEHLTKAYGGIIKINGSLGDIQDMVSEPKACHSILLKEQDVFEETSWFLEVNHHVFGDGLLSTAGPHHLIADEGKPDRWLSPLPVAVDAAEGRTASASGGYCNIC
ncbi:hypothetical protein FA95DRAFT_620727 [Auriscalpium vulgare]|uniref:Uncharacterized protein n=1 Tax=Auriscalpium vulgare TaxID=40419 RepID=A0ACB8S217_9AGAM|nr:hypothetical protein FA95DRAFT_620727 [Auriscalpium vulgare]